MDHRISIRENNTIGRPNQPLIVVDGIPMSNFASSQDGYWGNSAIDNELISTRLEKSAFKSMNRLGSVYGGEFFYTFSDAYSLPFVSMHRVRLKLSCYLFIQLID